MAKTMEVRQISFPRRLLNYLDQTSAELGIGLAEYIRHLVLKDIEEREKGYEILSEEDERAIDRSMDDYKNGNYVVLKPEDLSNYLDNLLKDK